MKPVAVFQHCANVRPGHFASFLEANGLPFRLIAIDRGDSVPADLDAFSGLCFMGGPMSVNDPLPWIGPELDLIRAAMARDMPVIGHCLGGQLMSRALGGTVTRNPVPEIGWGAVRACAAQEAADWLGDAQQFDVYQWHGETFSLPPGATRILEGKVCRNQAWVMGPHLAMQFHIEMTEALIQEWNETWSEAFADSLERPPSVQTPEEQFARLPQALPAMRMIAERLYRRWVRGLRA